MKLINDILSVPRRCPERAVRHRAAWRRATAAGLGWLLALPSLPLAQPQVGAARTMLVSVWDRANRPTVDVGPDDFVVEEGNDERDILAVQVADYPVTLLLDNGTDSDTLARMREAALRFVRRIGQRPVAVATLAGPPAGLATFDDERSQVIDVIERLQATPGAAARPLGALAQAAEWIRARRPPFSVVVLLATRPADPADQPDTDRLGPIVESGAAVHVVALLPVTGAAIEGPDLFRTVAEQTRGAFTPIYAPVSFGIALDRLADRLSA
ncbi:MAG: hypothetical protein AB7N65_15850, partial [Vicinamibacterales bacterium]